MIKVRDLQEICSGTTCVDLNINWQSVYRGKLHNISDGYGDLLIDSFYISAYPTLVMNSKIDIESIRNKNE